MLRGPRSPDVDRVLHARDPHWDRWRNRPQRRGLVMAHEGGVADR